MPLPSSPDRSSSRPGWLLWGFFAFQLGIIEAFDAVDDVVRGDLFPPSVSQAERDAHEVVHFESIHGFFVEPGLFTFARQAHEVLGIHLSAGVVTDIANNVYAFFHFGIPVGVALWVYWRHRERFGLLRNAIILVCLVALLSYFLYPTAPPRLTTEIIYHGHPFHFHNTMPYPKGGITINGRPLGFNPYSAIPSLHIAWASIVAGTVWLLSRNPVWRVLAALYPVLMTFAIVMTANHYIMDAVGGVLTVAVAAPIAFGIDRAWQRWRARGHAPSTA